MRVSGDLYAWQYAFVALQAGGLRSLYCSGGLTWLFSCLLSPSSGMHPRLSLATSHDHAILRGAGFMLQVRLGHISIVFCLLPCASHWGLVMVAAERYTAGCPQELIGFFASLCLFSLLPRHCCDRVFAMDWCRVVTSRMAMAPAARASTVRSLMYVVEKWSPFWGDSLVLSPRHEVSFRTR